MSDEGPLLLTTLPWFNTMRAGKWEKVPALKGGFAFKPGRCTFAYGVPAPPGFWPDEAPLQTGLVTCPDSFLLVIDVDHPGDYEALTRTGKRFGRDQAMSTRDDHYHVGFDMRDIPADDWPQLGQMAGADIKSLGFVAAPGSVHYSGALYEPHLAPDGALPLIRATADIVADMRADREDFYTARRAAGNGSGADHDTDQAGVALRCVLAGMTDDQVRDEWDKTAAHDRDDCDEAGAMGDTEFARHLASARRKAPQFAAEQAQRADRDELLLENLGTSSEKIAANGHGPRLMLGTSIADPSAYDHEDAQYMMPVRRVQLTAASGIEKKKVRWTWRDRLPACELSLMLGREGASKSTLSLYLAARLTRGTLPGEHFLTPKTVLICAHEDSWEHTIVPRLVAADADLTLVHKIDVITETGGEDSLMLPLDTGALAAAITGTGAALVILDPVMSRIDGRLDSHKDADTRRALEPLARAAQDTGTAVLGLIHQNKSGSTDALNSMMGSRAFAAVARSVLLVMAVPPVPSDPDGAHRVAGHAKCSVGPKMPMIGYTITDTPAGTDADGAAITAGAVHDFGVLPVHGTIEDFFADSVRGPEKRTAADKAADWLVAYLTEHGGQAGSADVKAAAEKEGHAWRTVQRARADAGVVIENVSEKPRRTVWKLPQEDEPDPPAEDEDQSRHARGGSPDSGATTTWRHTLAQLSSSELGKHDSASRAKPQTLPARDAAAGVTGATSENTVRPATGDKASGAINTPGGLTAEQLAILAQLTCPDCSYPVTTCPVHTEMP